MVYLFISARSLCIIGEIKRELFVVMLHRRGLYLNTTHMDGIEERYVCFFIFYGCWFGCGYLMNNEKKQLPARYGVQCEDDKYYAVWAL